MVAYSISNTRGHGMRLKRAISAPLVCYPSVWVFLRMPSFQYCYSKMHLAVIFVLLTMAEEGVGG